MKLSRRLFCTQCRCTKGWRSTEEGGAAQAEGKCIQWLCWGKGRPQAEETAGTERALKHAGMEFQEAGGEGGMLLVAINARSSWHLAGWSKGC